MLRTMKRYVGYNWARRIFNKAYYRVKELNENCASYDEMFNAAWPGIQVMFTIPRDDILWKKYNQMWGWLGDRLWEEDRVEALRDTY